MRGRAKGPPSFKSEIFVFHKIMPFPRNHYRHRASAAIVALVLFFMGAAMYGVGEKWQKPRKKSADNERITLQHADNLRFAVNEMNGANRLSGHVALQHAGMVMYCDSAVLYEDSQTFDAFGHVHIIQGDTLSLTGETLHYDGETLIAEVRRNVVMKHRNQTLHTDSLNYDRLYNVGYYFEGGNMQDGNNKLTSDWGEYHTDTRKATFNYNVELINPKFRLLTDTLHYDTQTKWAEVTGATNIYSGSDKIYTEHGFYNSETEQVRLFKKSQAFGKDRVMKGDTVYYNKHTGVMEAFSNVECVDTANKNILTGDYAFYNELTGEAMATKKALVRDYSQGEDTLYVHADTLRMYTFNIQTDSVYRVLHGYFHARAYRKDVQAVADSLVFSSQQNILTLYRDPIVWSDNRQILGEEITVFMNDSTIDSAYVDRQALMIEQLDSVHYNQVGANQMRSYYANGEVRENQAIGNVCVVNFPLEKDSTILYQNYVETARARMFMSERKLQKIWAPQSHGYFYPIGLAPADRTRLAGFAWFDYIRPVSSDDVFLYRGKKSGTQLKPTIRREAPLQHL